MNHQGFMNYSSEPVLHSMWPLLALFWQTCMKSLPLFGWLPVPGSWFHRSGSGFWFWIWIWIWFLHLVSWRTAKLIHGNIKFLCNRSLFFFIFLCFFFTKPLADSCRSHRVPHTEEVWSFASKGHNSVWRKVLRTEAGPTSINSFQHTLGNYLENKNSLCTAVGVGEGSTQVPIQNWRLADLDGLPDLFPSEKPPLWTGSRLALIRDGCCLLWLPPGAR